MKKKKVIIEKLNEIVRSIEEIKAMLNVTESEMSLESEPLPPGQKPPPEDD